MMNYKNSSFSGPNLARSVCWPIGHCLWRYRQWFLFPAFFFAFQATVSAQHKLISYDRQEVPQFTDAANGSFTLQAGSPAIDAGDNAAWTATGLMTDAVGNTRPVGTVDMGAFERQQASCPTGNILYVATTATGANDGTSWTDAFTNLQNALNSNCPGITQIWVAAGTYYPTSGTDRNATFQLKDGLALYGGFDGTETMLDQRDFVANATILSGDLKQDDSSSIPLADLTSDASRSDNAYSVVTGSGTDATALLDGFTITAGNANGGGFPNNFGGGMFNNNGSPILANCTFSRNSASGGGGMYNTGSSPSLTNCTFSRNSASNGGGMFNDDSSPSLTNCTFSGNSDGNIGGGMFNQGSSPTITNCTFSGNSASSIGGGMANFSSSPTITNCTFSGNSASFGGGMANFSSSPTVKNTIIWNNRANGVTNTASASISNSGLSPNIAYSLIANSGGSASWIGTIGTDGGGNIDADPQFTDAANGGFTLQAGSPAIDAGDNAAWTATGLMTDAVGNTRPVGTVDMGAFERQQASCPTGNILYVATTATGANDGTSWTDAFTNLQNALNSNCPGITQIWVAAGTYYPTSGTDRNATFQLKDGLALYGGFDGTETMLDQRDFVANATILSGDLKQDDSSSIPLADLTSDASRSDNAYSVVTGSGTDATAVLDGFTITGGNANNAASGSSLTFNPSNSGGGMYNKDGSPTVMNCTFSGDSAAYGGGMYNNSSFPTVTNCSFSGNSAAYGAGGGMYNNGSSPTVTNCTFSGNSAFRGGGGISNEGSSPTVTNCTFSGNSAGNTSSGGGGMSNATGSPTITNCTFSGNSSAGPGGGMSNGSSSATITNCTFSGNSAATGGGMYNSFASPTVTNCTFSGNSAAGRGGGMYNVYSSPSPTLTNCTFSGNSAGSFGGGMYNLQSSPTVTNSIIWNNSADGSTTTASASVFNSNINITPSFTSYSLIANSGGSGSWIGAIGSDGGGNIDADPQFTDAANGSFTLQAGSPAIDAGDNAAWTATGLMTDAVGNTRPVGTVDMGAFERQQVSCPTGNILYVAATATGANDGTSWTDAFTDLQNALNSSCPGITQIWVAAGTYYPTSGTDRNATFQLKDGLALYGGFDGTETMLDQRDFVANATILSGDLKQDDSSSIPLADLTSDASRSDNAYSVVTGSGTDATAVLDGFTITGGNADDTSVSVLNPNRTGGGMYNNAGSPTVTNCSFSGNSAAYGGGMYNRDNSSPTVTNCTFSGNSAGLYGGGMHNLQSSPTVTNSSFSGNSAASGGGGMSNFSNSSATITNCTFSGNSAATGGGMYNSFASPTVTNCTFSGNSAATGGGLYNGIASPTISNCTFSGNSAGTGGGLYNGIASPTISNCTFSGNSAAGRGGGMYNVYSSPSPTVTNCTFSGNSAGSFGGGMYNWQSSPTVTNSIIWNNSADGSTTTAFASVFNSNINITPSFTSYSLIANSGGSASWIGAIGTDGGGNTDADPLFAAPLAPGLSTGGNYRLQACSPAINAGSNAAVPMGITTDLDGNPRFLNDGKVDMGAYEFQSMAVCLALSGNILWEHERVANPTPVPDATVTLSGDNAGSESTDLLGGYAIPSFGGSSLTLTPTKTGNAYEGVDVADVARIQQHVTFINRFDDGYKAIAADVNQSSSVTGLDAAIIFHAINGNPNAKSIFETESWRFVDAAHSFDDENNPWTPAFPEDISLTNVMDDVADHDFVGVKMGDVNGSWATPLGLLAPALNWAIPDAALKAGQTLRVPFRANGLPDVAAWQFALRFDTDYLRFERALPTAAFPLKDENFGAWQAERGELRSVFAVPQGLVLPKDEVIFELEFQVVRGGLSLSELLRLADDVLPGRVYDTALNGGAVALTFAAVETRRIASLPPGEHALGFALQQNIPNPFSNETLIRFQLPEAGEAVFSVHDVQGRLLYEQRGFLDAGSHEVRLDAARLGATGVLSYTLRCGAHSTTRRMVLVR